MSKWSRKDFLRFVGRTGAALGGLGLAAGCDPIADSARSTAGAGAPFRPVKPTDRDDLVLAAGLEGRLLLREDDLINRKGELFGKCNDYIAFLPDRRRKDRGLLWVNHEMPLPLIAEDAGRMLRTSRSKADTLRMQEWVGGSLVAIQRDSGSGRWKLDGEDKRSRRFTGRTEIPIVSDEPIRGSRTAIGTLGNCAGGVTPWGTILTCEENHRDYYGERDYETGEIVHRRWNYGWHRHFDYPPEHYGWVVEIDPESGDARKLTSLGRFHHECATVREAPGGRVAVYTGDDIADGCLYKFISDGARDLTKGTLYAADMEAGRWIPLTPENEALKKYDSQLDILIQARRAARDAGGTPLDRPEDIEIDPNTGAVFASLTYNAKRLNFYGSILKIVERDNDPLALEFQADTFLTGGAPGSFACPDNLCFDPRGNLWLASDISGSAMNSYPYGSFGNNGLFFIPLEGDHAGHVFQVGSAPVDAEFTGLCFTPDGKSLFVSVQHPGIESKYLNRLSSNWPNAPGDLPQSAVVELHGPLLEKLSAV